MCVIMQIATHWVLYNLKARDVNGIQSTAQRMLPIFNALGVKRDTLDIFIADRNIVVLAEVPKEGC